MHFFTSGSILYDPIALNSNEYASSKNERDTTNSCCSARKYSVEI